ncbi:MAG: hypothetical protein H6716_08310 [Polyangiaceae bacterium]|nr:hypothetical protein [Polyangiaceae bacterium]
MSLGSVSGLRLLAFFHAGTKLDDGTSRSRRRVELPLGLLEPAAKGALVVVSLGD